MKINEVIIDNRNGMGATPYNQEVNYRGLRVLMKPSVFLDLAAFLSPDDKNSHVEKAIQDGAAIGAPFLIIRIPAAWFDSQDYSEPAQISGHEGRNRMRAVMDVEGNSPIETHLFFRDDIRNRDLTPEIINELNKGMYMERTRVLKRGPLFTYSEIALKETLKHVKGKWALVSKSNPKKVLQYYHGSGHPSEEWVKKVERRVHSFSEGVGRITPQNVTKDVGLNQTSIEAAKFGNQVDRDGYPKRLMRTTLKESQGGDCFVAAAREILPGKIPELTLVHAIVTGQGAIKGKRFPHAWNEIGDIVIDNSNGRNIIMRREQYYKLGKVNPKDPAQYRKYTHKQALEWMVKTKNYGPWELDES